MDELLGRIEERVGLDRADLLGLVVAVLGGVVAVIVALRVPLLAAVTEPALPDVAPLGVAADAAAEADVAAAEVVVHVVGAVLRPGVVVLPGGARVVDALDAAGGTSGDAAVEVLNLARPLVDGEQVFVPTREQVEAGAVGEGAAPGGAGVDADRSRLPDGRIDLNHADATTLETLPGVGPVLAARIVSHRDEHGAFDEAADLRDVSGIGEATWLNLRDLVGVS